MEVQIRREELNKMYDGAADSIIEVFDAFLDTEQEVLEELAIAFENENEKLIRQQLHYHAPVFGYVGFPQLVLFFKAMENKYTSPVGIPEMKKDHAEVVQLVKDVSAVLQAEKELMKTTAHA